MGRPPIVETAMSGAERVRHYRLKHDAPKASADLWRETLDTLRRERDAALNHVASLQAELQRAQQIQVPLAGRPVIADSVYRLVRGLLHPDRVTDPAAKEYLNSAFIKFTDKVKEIGGASALPSLEEMKRRRAQQSAAAAAMRKG